MMGPGLLGSFLHCQQDTSVCSFLAAACKLILWFFFIELLKLIKVFAGQIFVPVMGLVYHREKMVKQGHKPLFSPQCTPQHVQ